MFELLVSLLLNCKCPLKNFSVYDSYFAQTYTIYTVRFISVFSHLSKSGVSCNKCRSKYWKLRFCHHHFLRSSPHFFSLATSHQVQSPSRSSKVVVVLSRRKYLPKLFAAERRMVMTEMNDNLFSRMNELCSFSFPFRLDETMDKSLVIFRTWSICWLRIHSSKMVQ